MSKPVILYHGGNCHDGFTAAWVAWRKFGDQAKYIPCNYGEEPYQPEGDDGDIYLLDYSYKCAEMERLAKAQSDRDRRLVVLDHHKTAIQELAAWVGDDEVTDTTRVLAYDSPDKRVVLTFDLDECGSTLAWDYFFPGHLCPRLLHYVRDRDLWLKELPHNGETRAYMESLDLDFGVWNDLSRELTEPHEFTRLVREGESILRYKRKQIEAALEHAVPVILCGRAGFAVNCTVHFSEVAGELSARDEATFGCAYFRRNDGLWQYSLRSRGEHDVDGLAKEMGGGGHPKAAGFQTKEFIW